jgi:hypothetical protein
MVSMTQKIDVVNTDHIEVSSPFVIVKPVRNGHELDCEITCVMPQNYDDQGMIELVTALTFMVERSMRIISTMAAPKQD